MRRDHSVKIGLSKQTAAFRLFTRVLAVTQPFEVPMLARASNNILINGRRRSRGNFLTLISLETERKWSWRKKGKNKKQRERENIEKEGTKLVRTRNS